MLSSMQMKTDVPSFLRKMASIILQSLWALTAGQKAVDSGNEAHYEYTSEIASLDNYKEVTLKQHLCVILSSLLLFYFW